MSLYKHFSADIDIASVAFPKNDDGTVPTFRLARMNETNMDYTKALEKAQREHRLEIELEMLDEAVARPIMLRVFCETVLKGWDNVQDATGATVAFTTANAIKLLTDLPDLYRVLATKAGQLTTFQKKEVEEATKKS